MIAARMRCSAPIPAATPSRVARTVHLGADRGTSLLLSQAFFDRIAAPKWLVIPGAAGQYTVETPGIHQLAGAFAAIGDRLISGPGSAGR
ncbi:hypothetical protein [Nocardia sp. NPDC057455]|uniref:hypothetical protein n=1 Tax=Nocardia sp. NPDC057455 TaxID=3346138 RepID=UPI00367344E9